MALEMIKAQGGIFGWVSDSSGFLAALGRHIRTPRRQPRDRRDAYRVPPSGWRTVSAGHGGANRGRGSRRGRKPRDYDDWQFRPRLWVPGDWNAFFGLGTNVLLNVLVLAGLALGVIELPADTVFGRILPALAHRPAARQPVLRLPGVSTGEADGRDDVDGDAVRARASRTCSSSSSSSCCRSSSDRWTSVDAWQAGLAWAFIIGVIVLIGAFVGPTIRKYTPRAAMLGTLAGISIAFISMRPAFQMFEVPWIAFAAFAHHPDQLDGRRAAAVRRCRAASLAVSSARRDRLDRRT